MRLVYEVGQARVSMCWRMYWVRLFWGKPREQIERQAGDVWSPEYVQKDGVLLHVLQLREQYSVMRTLRTEAVTFLQGYRQTAEKNGMPRAYWKPGQVLGALCYLELY
jgi:hypothetical protein